MLKLDQIRPALVALVTHGVLLLKLAQVEWAAEKLRLVRMIVLSLVAMVMAVTLLLSLSILAMALAWDTPYRLAVALGVIVVYALGLGIALNRLKRMASLKGVAFAGMREELSADFALLKRKLSHDQS